MSVFKPTKIEWISFWVLMPVISVITSHLLYGNRIWHEGAVFAGAFAAVYIIGFVSWYLHILTMHILAVLLPDLKQTIIRLLLLALVHFMLITATMYTYFYGFDAVSLFGYVLNKDDFRTSVWVGLFLTMIATSLWQVEYIFNKWKISLSEKELVEQQRLLQEFEDLKRQINPHFLFNNLNILSSLISEDPQRAEYFLDELGKVYRYLLRNNDDGITTVESELKFIRSYYALLKIRHSDAVQMTIDVDSRYNSHYLPSFSLQLLVENAVKHNIANKANPLYININTDAGGSLNVSNNLQQKNENILSNNVGLSNIAANYRLLLNRELTVDRSGGLFNVKLPLIHEINHSVS